MKSSIAAVLLGVFVLAACTTAGTQHERQSRTADEATQQHVEILDAAKRIVEAAGESNAAVAEAAASQSAKVTNIYHGDSASSKKPWFQDTGVDGMCFPDRGSHNEFMRRGYCRETPALKNCTQFTEPCGESVPGTE